MIQKKFYISRVNRQSIKFLENLIDNSIEISIFPLKCAPEMPSSAKEDPQGELQADPQEEMRAGTL